MIEQIQNFISIFVGLLGLIVVSMMFLSYKSNILINIYLIIIFLFASLRLIDIGVFGFYKNHIVIKEFDSLKPIFLMVVVCFYLYFKSLFEDPRYFKIQSLKHFGLPVLYIAINLLHVVFPELQNDYFTLAIQISIFTFILFYSIKSGWLIFDMFFRKQKSKHDNEIHFYLIRKWCIFFYSIAIILNLRLIYSLFFEIQSNQPMLGYSFSLINSVIWFILFLKIISTPEILFGCPKLKNRITKLTINSKAIDEIWSLSNPKPTNIQDSKLNNTIDTKIENYIIDIESFVNCSFPFRNSDYSINSLSKELNIPSSHLAYIFKYHSKLAFVEFKNYSKINDALNLINDGFLDTKTFEALSEKVGFVSYNSFFKSFKKYTNYSPKDYLASLSIN